MYILLVGSPGIKKSTAMKMARKLIQEVGGMAIAPAAITKEALTQWMAEPKGGCRRTFQHDGNPVQYTHVSIFANEVVSLLNAGGNPVGMIEFLTDVWDQDKMEVRTKNKGHDLIERPFVHILGCMTPQTMQQLLFQKIVSGGFNRRCIFVLAEHNEKPVPRPMLTPEQEQAWNFCLNDGKRLQGISGKFEWDDEAKDFFDSWYEENFYRTEQMNEDFVFQAYLRSKAEYVLKLGMIIALSEDSLLVLLKEHLEVAIAFLNQIEPGYRKIFQATGRNELSPIAVAIESMVINAIEPVMWKEVIRQYRREASLEEIESVLKHLVSAGVLDKFETTKGGTLIKYLVPPGGIALGKDLLTRSSEEQSQSDKLPILESDLQESE